MNLSPTSVLRLNPALIVWPSDALRFTLSDPLSRDASFFNLPRTAVEVLQVFAEPRCVEDAFERVDGSILSSLQEAVHAGWLLKAELAASPPPRFKSFALAELPSAATAARAMRGTVSRKQVNGKHIFTLDGCFSKDEILDSFR